MEQALAEGVYRWLLLHGVCLHKACITCLLKPVSDSLVVAGWRPHLEASTLAHRSGSWHHSLVKQVSLNSLQIYILKGIGNMTVSSDHGMACSIFNANVADGFEGGYLS